MLGANVSIYCFSCRVSRIIAIHASRSKSHTSVVVDSRPSGKSTGKESLLDPNHYKNHLPTSEQYSAARFRLQDE